MFDYEVVLEQAESRYHRWLRSGVRGQMMSVHDSLDYWIAQVAYEYGFDDGLIDQQEKEAS